MRAMLVLALVGLIGCMDAGASDPSVSVNYQRNERTVNGHTTVSIEATLTRVEGLDDWSELRVTGCDAPSSGPFEIPHTFTGCAGRLTIQHVGSGDILYRSE